MLADHLTELVKQKLGHPPTPGQETLISHIAGFIFETSGKVFIVKGFAGTGKTSLISALVKTLDELKLKTLLLAPTGRAAKVFSAYAGKNAYTIHRKIYRQKSSADGFGSFVLNKNLYSNMTVIVDEASMISDSLNEGAVFGSGRLLADLISFVKDGQNCRLILVGDTAQLPPVGINISPALDKDQMSIYMPVAGEFLLTHIVRQDLDSGILRNATLVRNKITNEELVIPAFSHHGLPDVQFISGNEIIERLEKAYAQYGLDEVMVLCRSNKRANQYNAGIRNQVLFRDEEISTGDLLMIVKNNYYWLKNQPDLEFIANGDIVKVLKVKKFTDQYGFRFARVLLSFIDYNLDFEAWLLLDTLTTDTPSLGTEENRKLYYSVLEDYSHLKTRGQQYKAVKEDEFFNALQVKYAYAVTGHKAQGGQWKAVFIDQGFVKTDQVSLEYLRWLYTAITRATKELYFVNFPKTFMLNDHSS